MPSITPYLWFDDQAEEAATFYTSVFDDARILEFSRYAENGPKPPGTAMVVVFELQQQRFMALNAGPEFKFTEAISFLINCDDQSEVDRYWAALTANGGQPGQCGWLKDKYGMSWQVVPKQLAELLQDKDPGRASRVMQSMMQMTKIDVHELRRAADQA